ncbi:MAG: hypothetical protein ACOYKD_08805 [Anaerolineaceae bacterium]|jgi:hypothetical protein
MRVIKASELGSFRYCQRAWWYQFKGYTNENTNQLNLGKEKHSQHARGVNAAAIFKILSLLLAITAFIWALLQVLQ